MQGVEFEPSEEQRRLVRAMAGFGIRQDDIAGLLKQLGMKRADILGFSNGGHVAIEIALRHPTLVRKLVLCSTNIGRDGMPPEFWKGMENPKFADMPQAYKDAFLKVNNDQAALMRMFERDSSRMRVFKGWNDDQIKLIKMPVFIVNGDRNDILLEHVVRDRDGDFHTRSITESTRSLHPSIAQQRRGSAA